MVSPACAACSAAQIIEPGALRLAGGVYEDMSVVERFRLIGGVQNQVDEGEGGSAARAVLLRLEAAKCAGLHLHPVGTLGGWRADAQENITVGNGTLNGQREVITGAHLLRIEPVVHAPGVQRGQQRCAPLVVVMRVANEHLPVAAHPVLS